MNSRPIKVDRENNRLLGYVVATAGPLKDGRAEFTEDGLREIVRLGNANPLGIRSRFNHAPSLGGLFTEDGGLGRHLGRAFRFGMSTAKMRDGRTVAAVRADLHLDPTALRTPPGGGRPLGEYVLHLIQTDPDACSSSIVAVMRTEYRLNPNGTRLVDKNGEDLPPIWTPINELISSDLVTEGAAVDAVLAVEPTGADAVEYRRKRAEQNAIRSKIAMIDEELRRVHGTTAELEARKARNRAAADKY